MTRSETFVDAAFTVKIRRVNDTTKGQQAIPVHNQGAYV